MCSSQIITIFNIIVGSFSIISSLCVIYLFRSGINQRKIIIATESLKVKNSVKDKLVKVIQKDSRKRVLILDIGQPYYEEKVRFIDMYERGVRLGIFEGTYIKTTDRGFIEVTSDDPEGQRLLLATYLPFEEIIGFEESYDFQISYPILYLKPYYKWEKQVYGKLQEDTVNQEFFNEMVDYKDVKHISNYLSITYYAKFLKKYFRKTEYKIKRWWIRL